VIAYAFSRAKRRTIGFVVGPEGLSVRAPRWTPLSEVEAALQEKGRWIFNKLQEMQERQQIQEQSRIVWADGVNVMANGDVLLTDSSIPSYIDPLLRPPAKERLDAGRPYRIYRVRSASLPH